MPTDSEKYKAIAYVVLNGSPTDEWQGRDLFDLIEQIVDGAITDLSPENLDEHLEKIG